MKKYLFVLLSMILVSSCALPEQKPSANKKMQIKTERQMQEADRQVGFPGIKNFREKKNMKMILELRDQEDLVCYAYLFNSIEGRVGQYLGRCIGYGLPYSTQFSNPMTYRHKDEPNGGDYGIFMPQAEPNGLFMPEGLAATWLMMIDSAGSPRPVYVEPEIIVSPFKLH